MNAETRDNLLFSRAGGLHCTKPHGALIVHDRMENTHIFSREERSEAGPWAPHNMSLQYVL